MELQNSQSNSYHLLALFLFDLYITGTVVYFWIPRVNHLPLYI